MGSLRFTLMVGIIAASMAHASAAPSLRLLRSAIPSWNAPVQLADARSYHHCHNTPRHIRCHKRGARP